MAPIERASVPSALPVARVSVTPGSSSDLGFCAYGPWIDPSAERLTVVSPFTLKDSTAGSRPSAGRGTTGTEAQDPHDIRGGGLLELAEEPVGLLLAVGAVGDRDVAARARAEVDALLREVGLEAGPDLRARLELERDEVLAVVALGDGRLDAAVDVILT